MTKWLVKVVEGRYRCWDDFLQYGMLSAGHGDPPADPLKLLTAGDEVYAFLNTRGYVGRGQVTSAGVLAAEFVVSGNFVSMDGSMRSKRVRLSEIVLLRRSDMTNEGSDPWSVSGSSPSGGWPLGRGRRRSGSTVCRSRGARSRNSLMQKPRGSWLRPSSSETFHRPRVPIATVSCTFPTPSPIDCHAGMRVRISETSTYVMFIW
jgi:hypothetical protein